MIFFLKILAPFYFILSKINKEKIFSTFFTNQLRWRGGGSTFTPPLHIFIGHAPMPICLPLSKNYKPGRRSYIKDINFNHNHRFILSLSSHNKEGLRNDTLFTGEFSKRVRMISQEVFVTPYTLSVYPYRHKQLTRYLPNHL